MKFERLSVSGHCEDMQVVGNTV